jgi:CHAT domain-containing protein
MAQAMRATLDSRRAANASTHPYYWAAFVGEGGWR